MKTKPLSQEVPCLQINRKWESLPEEGALYSFYPLFKNPQLTFVRNKLLGKKDLDLTQNSRSAFLIPSSIAFAIPQGEEKIMVD